MRDFTTDLTELRRRVAGADSYLNIDTAREQIAALKRVAGDAVVARIRREPDAAIIKIVSGWPTRFDAKRARALGFKVEDSFEEIIRAHIDDELEGRVAA